jgi:hypothetical protein
VNKIIKLFYVFMLAGISIYNKFGYCLSFFLSLFQYLLWSIVISSGEKSSYSMSNPGTSKMVSIAVSCSLRPIPAAAKDIIQLFEALTRID